MYVDRPKLIERLNAGESSRRLDAEIEVALIPDEAVAFSDEERAGFYGLIGNRKDIEAPPHSTGTPEDRAAAAARLAEPLKPSDEEVARMRPDPAFTAALAKFPRRKLHSADGMVGHSLSDKFVLNHTPMRDALWAELHAYMHRRFGPPNIPGDDYKDLSAAWMLDSPNPDVFILVRPSLSGMWHSFVCFLAAPKDETPSARCEREAVPEYREAVRSAFAATLIDLVRPVCVRDQSFNPLGIVGDEDLMEWDEDQEKYPLGADYHPSSGSVLPYGLFGSEAYYRLCSILHAIDPDDSVKALDRLLKGHLAEEIGKAAALSPEARVLFLASLADSPAAGSARAVARDANEAEQAARLRERLLEDPEECKKYADAVSDADVDAAEALARRLGLETRKDIWDMRFMIDENRKKALGERIAADFLAVLSTLETPIAIECFEDFDLGFNYPGPRIDTLEEKWRPRMPELADWLKRSLEADPKRSCLSVILWNIAYKVDTLAKANPDHAKRLPVSVFLESKSEE